MCELMFRYLGPSFYNEGSSNLRICLFTKVTKYIGIFHSGFSTKIFKGLGMIKEFMDEEFFLFKREISN